MPLLMCPNDNASMQSVNRGGVEFDMCPACRGVWLDRGELEKLIEGARAAMEPSRPRPMPLRHAGFLVDMRLGCRSHRYRRVIHGRGVEVRRAEEDDRDYPVALVADSSFNLDVHTLWHNRS